MAGAGDTYAAATEGTPVEAPAEAEVVEKLTHLEKRILLGNPEPHDIVRLLMEAVYDYDVKLDPAWPLRNMRAALLYYVRCVNTCYGHMFEASYKRADAEPVKPPESQHWLQQRVLLSCQTLFFESVRRVLMVGDGDEITCKKVKLVLESCNNREPMSEHLPLRLITPEVLGLIGMSFTELERQDGPHMQIIAEVPWLANEIYTVCEPNYAEIKQQVQRKHRELYCELFPEEARASAGANSQVEGTEASDGDGDISETQGEVHETQSVPAAMDLDH